MSDFLLVLLPLVMLIFGFVCCILFWKEIKVQQSIALIVLLLYLFLGGLLVYRQNEVGVMVAQIGNWPVPLGITLVVDGFSALMILISGVVALAAAIFSVRDISLSRKKVGFYPALLVMMVGVAGSFLTGDVFNLYVWFEVMLLASFVLIILGNTKAQLEGAVKYVILSFISSGFLLTGIGILYKVAGTLNMADLSRVIATHPEPQLITLAAVFFFMGFGTKAAVFPLFFWLPASYPTAPISVSALMAGLLTKVGVYAFIRFGTLIFTQDLGLTNQFLLYVAGFTMFFGVLGAVAQDDFRRVLSFHIVSQIGYMLMGLALYTPFAIAAAVFYIVHHILVKTNLFLISGVVRQTNGYFLLRKLGGVYKHYPLVAILFVISAFSLAGIPPLSGFWGKYMLVKAGLLQGEYLLVMVSLVVGFLTLFSMTKIWIKAFWSPLPEETAGEMKPNLKLFSRANIPLIAPVILLALCTLLISLFPDVLVNYSMNVAEQLLDSSVYINAVLGDK